MTAEPPTPSPTQVFIIHRHGARYPLKKPEHNVLWPTENGFWKHHLGRLTPVGVLQMNQLGSFFRARYPWVEVSNVKIYSTHRSRALESAWSLALGLLPGAPIKFDSIKIYTPCTDQICCGTDLCCIHYYHKNDDPIFGRCDPSMAYKINVNGSELLQSYSQRSDVTALVERLSSAGRFRIRRDSVTTIAKLKDIYAQLQIDAQFGMPAAGTIEGRYGLSSEELELINCIGCEVIHRRLIPATDCVTDDIFNVDQGMGLVGTIHNTIAHGNLNLKNNLYVLSCHDTNLIAFMSILGLKIVPPDFAGYILIERNATKARDTVDVYYCATPFQTGISLEAQAPSEPKVWPATDQRDKFLEWSQLPSGQFRTADFLRMLAVSYI